MPPSDLVLRVSETPSPCSHWTQVHGMNIMPTQTTTCSEPARRNPLNAGSISDTSAER